MKRVLADKPPVRKTGFMNITVSRLFDVVFIVFKLNFSLQFQCPLCDHAVAKRTWRYFVVVLFYNTT